MPSTSVPFHALPNEIADFVGDWAERFALSIVVIQFFPKFSAERLYEPQQLQSSVRSSAIPARFCLSTREQDVGAASVIEFFDRNPGVLVVDVGKHSKGRLVESAVSAKTEDEADIKVWRAITADLKKRTQAGLWGLNPNTGAKHYYRQNRYTAAAAEQARKGLQFAPLAGWTLFFVHEPPNVP